MGRTWVTLVAAALASSAAGQQPAYKPDFDPSAHKGPAASEPNEVLVLGTPHLSSLPTTFRPEDLGPLLNRLAAWRPRIITVEALSGAQCDHLRRFPARYAGTVESYCWDPAPARAATGLGVPKAIAEAERLLSVWPASPAPAERRRLAAVFLAAGDQASALVQWLRLPLPERRAGDGLDAGLAARLETLRTRRNEDFLIAAPLAARLGLERVHPTDDHSADSAPADEKGYAEAMRRIWANPAVARRQALEERLNAGLGSAQGVLALYRAHNAPDLAKLVYDSDFGAAHADRSPEGHGRRYLGYWETRNLRMVANIRDVMASAPGGRTLAIVGTSHKSYFEAYLHMMHDVRLVAAAAVLR